MPAKIIHEPNFARSAMAPEIEGDSDDGEGRLETGEREAAEVGAALAPHQVLQPECRERVSEPVWNQRGAERHPVAVEHPEHPDQRHGAETHHHHADDALGLHHAAVEEGDAGSHQQHECRRDEEPECIDAALGVVGGCGM
jgi:hypothetical protein